MKIETFFEKFDQFADWPKAMQKMRELVLQLAVRGRLVEQDPNDESADTLLARLTNRTGLDNYQRRKSQPMPAITPDEIPFGLPSGWAWERLGNIGETNIGLTYSPGDVSVVGIPVLRSSNIQKGKLDFSDLVRVKLDPKQSLMVQDGDLLICARNGSRALVGKVAMIQDLNEPTAFGAFMAIFRSEVNQYLYHFICSPLFRQMIGEVNTTTINQITQNNLRSTLAPIPPLAEQHRIVAKVDELMRLCDQLGAQQHGRDKQHTALSRAALTHFGEAPTSANLKFLFHDSYTIEPADLRKTILALAVQGKLVPQDPNDESAEECLSRLGLKSTVAFLNADDADYDSLPPSWTRVRFEDVALVAGGVTLGRKLAQRKTVTLPYLRVANVKRGEIDLSVIKNVSIAENEIDRYALRENDLLMTEGGDWDKVGRAAIWRAEIPVCLHQNHIFRARMRSPEITPFWFEHYFNSPDGRGYFESASKQTTNLASINMRQVRNCPIPFPPLAEQRRIVSKINELMSLVDQLEAQLVASRVMETDLMDAIVAELTAQV
ncbi:MAG: restriction endonuclease subunit S [Desulfomonile tiedjei]|uniref:Restriction endonuclease subunit S n=1 Tax=Desulfomonile tiedjei TaxID=2358 RepID=A0A9D6V285_9BACT|nr:restriction endonuclease subunit S [Desulfomonile tiedjei]